MLKGVRVNSESLLLASREITIHVGYIHQQLSARVEYNSSDVARADWPTRRPKGGSGQPGDPREGPANRPDRHITHCCVGDPAPATECDCQLDWPPPYIKEGSDHRCRPVVEVTTIEMVHHWACSLIFIINIHHHNCKERGPSSSVLSTEPHC